MTIAGIQVSKMLIKFPNTPTSSRFTQVQIQISEAKWAQSSSEKSNMDSMDQEIKKGKVWLAERGGDLLRVQKDQSLHSCPLITNNKHSNNDNSPLHNIIPQVLPAGNLESITVTLVIREAADVSIKHWPWFQFSGAPLL